MKNLQTPNQPTQGAPTISQEIVKNSKNLECANCGNLIFEEKMTFKKISAIMSPSAKEELLPIAAIVCSKCGLIPY